MSFANAFQRKLFYIVSPVTPAIHFVTSSIVIPTYIVGKVEKDGKRNEAYC